VGGGGGGKEDGVDAVDYTVGAELVRVSKE